MKNSQVDTISMIKIRSMRYISDIVSETIFRPLGVYYGAFFMLLITAGYLLISLYYGYDYNYLVGVVGYVIGYMFGVCVEQIIKVSKK